MRNPFRINVGFIVHEEVGDSHDFPFQFDRVRLADDLELDRFAAAVHVGKTAQGLLLTGECSALTVVECVRCLKSFSHPLKWTMSEVYAFSEKSTSESGLTLPEDFQIDLAPLIREYALLEIPMKPVCRPGCLGLCPVCGQDLNVRDCGHRPGSGTSPFAALRDFLPK
jgi:uncharacterized protein